MSQQGPSHLEANRLRKRERDGIQLGSIGPVPKSCNRWRQGSASDTFPNIKRVVAWALTMSVACADLGRLLFPGTAKGCYQCGQCG